MNHWLLFGLIYLASRRPSSQSTPAPDDAGQARATTPADQTPPSDPGWTATIKGRDFDTTLPLTGESRKGNWDEDNLVGFKAPNRQGADTTFFLQQFAYNALAQAQAEMVRNGYSIVMYSSVSAWRSLASQASLVEKYKDTNPGLAAPPKKYSGGHMRGAGLDLHYFKRGTGLLSWKGNEDEYVEQIVRPMEKAGWRRTAWSESRQKGEFWHFSMDVS